MPRQTSISLKNLVLPYSLFFEISFQLDFSEIKFSPVYLSNAATELTCKSLPTLALMQALTIFFVPSIFNWCSKFFSFGLNETIAAQ